MLSLVLPGHLISLRLLPPLSLFFSQGLTLPQLPFSSVLRKEPRKICTTVDMKKQQPNDGHSDGESTYDNRKT